jgi:hypothetical protein
MDPLLAKLGLDVVLGIGQVSVERARVKAQNRIDEATALARNLMRGANNELASKRGSLARFVQSQNNVRVSQETDSALAAAAVNYQRQRDSITRDNFESQIGFAEQAGAQAAASAASGLTGGVADLVAGTTALRRSRVEQAAADVSKAVAFDAAQTQKNTLLAGLSALQQSNIADDLDYGIDTYVPQAAPSYNGVIIKAAAGYLQGQPGKKAPFKFDGPEESYHGVK